MCASLTALFVASIAARSAKNPGKHGSSAKWVAPQGLPVGHNGGTLERLTSPAAGKQPHILMILLDE